jgi:hypothetical protein
MKRIVKNSGPFKLARTEKKNTVNEILPVFLNFYRCSKSEKSRSSLLIKLQIISRLWPHYAPVRVLTPTPAIAAVRRPSLYHTSGR